jgi:hypothetical protein
LVIREDPVNAIFAHFGVVAVGQFQNEFVRAHRPRRVDLLVGGIEFAVGDVAADRATDEEGVLQDNTEDGRPRTEDEP